ncbi:hypothetical protein GQ53DRAFT_794319 [Thozetella sp. PMI_491]|nr:hypothetical protein GQ53DRAFT_794319 [Thozetella sp. PMI_491]
MDQSAEAVTPAWGALPVEQYLMRTWDATSPLAPDQQRRELVRAFIQEDVVASSPSDPSIPAGAEEVVQSVLVPWRVQQLRRVAEKYVTQSNQLFDELVVLRTYYGGGAADDEKLRDWLEQADPMEDAFGGVDDRWWRVLNDATLFDMGSENWSRVYEVLPELAASSHHRAFSNKDIDATQELVLAKGDEAELEEDDYEDAIMGIASASSGMLLVVDQKAFENEEFWLIFRDKKGNIIKEGTIKPDEVQYLREYNSRGALWESEYWLDAAVGKKYKTRGEVMQALLPLVMAEAD